MIVESNLVTWENIFKSRDWGKYPSESIIRFIAKNFYKYPFQDRKNIKILELGSGIGANLWFCAKEGFSVIALEGSQTAIDIMIKRFKDENILDKLIFYSSGDYFNTLDQIENESIDAVIDCNSLCCNTFDRTKSIIEKTFLKLKNNGVMVSKTLGEGTWGLNGEEIDYHLVLPKEGLLANTGYVRYTNKEDIYNLYKLPNNKIENIEIYDRWINDNTLIREYVIELRKI